MTLVGKAFALAAEVHKDQVDKSGEPYILHPIAVMKLATEYHTTHGDGWQLQRVQAAALLHDVIEDATPRSTRQIVDAKVRDLDDVVYHAVDMLTKRGDIQHKEPYDEYLERVASDWIARTVKIADLTHNLDAFRLPSGKITERDYERWDKYHRALVRLRRED